MIRINSGHSDDDSGHSSRHKQMPKAKVNQEICIGCGTCESLCPSVFKMENGKSQVIAEECGECNCQEVVESCPVSAISME